ncbi:DUF6288 domain-containing protein [Haloferula sp. A504]|uniref:DUF6288 domain-containing protein n=1 Tax=Haloferula sp. A504 TaxID=3373601 RepID=UPI0031C75DB8|nr:DUF6288 domain-containing protein [Verrucomicrobiaceae bacterium E54]
MQLHQLPRFLTLALIGTILAAPAADQDAADENVYALRPKANAPRNFGHIGPTGIMAHIDTGVKVTVEGTREGSPADGKFHAGEVIVGVNGQALEGRNPYVVLGSAITAAEASDGKLSFDLDSEEGKRQVTLEIPVMGAYAAQWPVDCAKSRKIVQHAAAYYEKSLKESKDMGVGGALTCLFLLSTGDDTYLPLIKAHYAKFIENPEAIGDHTWNNGYNGIACAEYYLRTGDPDMLPVLQAFCDDARDRQNFDAAWKHWGTDINPRYVAGGLMNPASTQVLTTLLLSKEAGVNVDEKTLLNCLRYFYRFAGHGSVAYGDHRGEGGVGSNGKDAMLAAAMQVASGASGDTSIYQAARDSLSMATLNAYPAMITGHADNGRGDGMWRGIASTYLMEKKPAKFREVMDRITWWYDLSRFDDGAIGLATLQGWNDPGSGAGAAMTYTAPLKTLRITGAPRSEHAKEFQLPKRIWGNQADLAFLKIEPVDGYEEYGEPLAIHRITPLIGSAYIRGSVEEDPDSVSLDQLNQFVRHQSYMIRAQAAKALRIKGEWKVLEELLRHPDPRMRRAALDGMLDWRYFFGVGKKPLATGDYTPGMIEAITAMLGNPQEATYVIEGALFATGFMPAEVIQEHYDVIYQWTRHDDWWFRQASFMALQGLSKDPELYLKAVPVLTELMIRENHTMPRNAMNQTLANSLKQFAPDSEIGRLLAKGFDESVAETRILEGRRDREGVYNVAQSIEKAASMAPELAPQLAASLVERGLSVLDDDQLLGLIDGQGGFLKLAAKLKGPGRDSLEKILYESYRPEVVKRLKAGGGTDIRTIDALIGITELRDQNVGWTIIGSPEPQAREWHYLSFHPKAEKDFLPKREGRRYRQVELAPELKDWFQPGFDASGWQSGKAPIGKGGHPRAGNRPPENQSTWGEGEILLARTSFELNDTDYDLYRLRMLCIQGFQVYLNGKRIRTYSWWQEPKEYRKWPMGPREAALLKKGTNTLAIYTMEVYPSSQKPHWKDEVFGQLDCYIEGLRKEDLY